MVRESIPGRASENGSPMTTTSLNDPSQALPAAKAGGASTPPPSPAAGVADDKVPTLTKAAYAFGGTTDIFGHWLYYSLMFPVFIGFLGLAPWKLSVTQAASRLTDGFTDSYFGWRSDNTRSKWGRRRPYILIGSILAGLALPCLFMASPAWKGDENKVFWFVLLTACGYAPIISSYNMPYQSLGAELTPDYNERTTIMSWRAFVQTLAGIANAWAWWFAALSFFNDANGQPNIARGAMWAGAIAGGVMILAGLGNFFFTKERYYAKVEKQERIGFVPMMKQTFECRPYRILLLTLVLFAVPTSFVGSLGWFVQRYYVLGATPDLAPLYGGLSGTAYGLMGVLGVPFASRLAKKLGKADALKWALFAGVVALSSSFWLYTPEAPILSAICNGLYGITATGFWVLLPSMLADVVDYDELETGKRREGAFSSTFSWVLKLGTTITLLITGPLVEIAGFDASKNLQTPDTLLKLRIMFAVIPSVACLLAYLASRAFPLTRDRMAEIRGQLEARRGTV